MVQFSRETIVTGKPMIQQLETGSINRRMYFISQLNQTTLEFQYEVQLGDVINDLDYWTNEGLIRSSSSSFQLNGGTIMLPTSNSAIHADLHFNLTFGYLGGQKEISL